MAERIIQNITIRKAVLKDSEYIAPLLLLAMDDIVRKFIDERDNEKARDFLFYFIKKENNQYSYQNCYVAEIENQIIAAVNIYNGADLTRLRKPIKTYIEGNFKKSFHPEDETQAGEQYIDSLGVDPNYQGKGVGAKMLQFLINEYVIKKQQVLGLLVDEENPNAKRLYLNLKFKEVDEKMFVGKRMVHLQIKPKRVG